MLQTEQKDFFTSLFQGIHALAKDCERLLADTEALRLQSLHLLDQQEQLMEEHQHYLARLRSRRERLAQTIDQVQQWLSDYGYETHHQERTPP